MSGGCRHPGLLTVTGRPGVLWCPTCHAHLTEQPDGTLTPEDTPR